MISKNPLSNTGIGKSLNPVCVRLQLITKWFIQTSLL